MKRTIIFVLCALICAALYAHVSGPSKMGVTSRSFPDAGSIPREYTCAGDDLSPDISWAGAPMKTKTFMIIVTDPDIRVKTAARQEWTHWVVYNIPASVISLGKNQPKSKTLRNGASQARNDFREYGYGGPCPPSGTHRYFFRVYALDKEIALEPDHASKDSCMAAAAGHILAVGELMGKYSK